MKPIAQTDTSAATGDCLRASTAALFELNIEDVPNFMLAEDWWEAFNAFIWDIGYQCLQYVEGFDFIATKGGYLIAAIKSNYGDDYSHAVVINTAGLVVCDPLPESPSLGVNVKGGVLEHWLLIRKRK